MTERHGGPQFIPRPPSWRLIDEEPPWSAAGSRIVGLGPDDVRHAVAGRPATRLSVEADPGVRISAVAVLVYPDVGGLHVVLTRRAWTLREHRGEIAFPGGGAEAADRDVAATALREAHEEVALDPTLVEVVGELDHLTTRITDRVIVPVVGLLEGRPDLVPADTEVDGILLVPLAELAAAEVYRSERWDPWIGHPMHFFELGSDTVWGATATMLHEFLTVVAGGAL